MPISGWRHSNHKLYCLGYGTIALNSEQSQTCFQAGFSGNTTLYRFQHCVCACQFLGTL